MDLLQPLVNGLAQGMGFALLAVAFSLVHRASGALYIALGALYALTPYLVLALHGYGLPTPVAIACACGIIVGLSVVNEGLIHWPLERKRASVDVHFVASLGAFLLITQLVAAVWGPEARTLRPGNAALVELGGASLTGTQIQFLIVSSAVLAVSAVLLRYGDMGLRLRALAANPDLMNIYGHDVRALRRYAFGIAGLLAAAVSLLSASDVGFDPNGGMRAALIGMTAVLLGGRRWIFVGPAWAAIALGIVRALVVWFISARWEDAITFALVICYLFAVRRGATDARAYAWA